MRRLAKIIRLKTRNTIYMFDTPYKEMIEELARKDRNEVFFNTGKQHAIAVLSTIFDNAKDHVKLYAGNLKGGIADSPMYQKALEGFLDRNGQLTILLEEYDSQYPPQLFTLLKKYQQKSTNKIAIKTHNFTITEGEKQFNRIHFCVADSKMYRMEKDIKQFAAECNLNDPNITGELEKRFDGIFYQHGTVNISLSS